jgi:Flp pilus assembly protein TadB
MQTAVKYNITVRRKQEAIEKKEAALAKKKELLEKKELAKKKKEEAALKKKVPLLHIHSIPAMMVMTTIIDNTVVCRACRVMSCRVACVVSCRLKYRN